MSDRLEVALLAALDSSPDPSYRAEGGLSMSALGGCRRKAAYLLARTPQDEAEPSDAAAAEVGTALHRAVLPHMAASLGGACEQEVVWHSPAGPINGTVDLLLPSEVVDLKTVGRATFDLCHEPRTGWKHQVTAGALATGMPRCAVIVLDRDTGRRKTFRWDTAEFQADAEAWAVSVAGSRPDDTARDFRGPGVDRECDWCAFRSRCWPDVEGAAPQAAIIHDDRDVEDMLSKYLDAADREKQAASDKDFAKKCLTGTDPGRYGEWSLSWSRRGGKQSPDAKAMAALLADLGYPVPTKAGATYDVIGVKRA